MLQLFGSCGGGVYGMEVKYFVRMSILKFRSENIMEGKKRKTEKKTYKNEHNTHN